MPDGGDIARKLEGVLNSEVAISDPAKSPRVFQPTQTDDKPIEDYQSVHPNVLAQPDFRYLPAGLKIARVEEYYRINRELAKTREVRNMLRLAEQDSTQRRLMADPSELQKIVDHLDSDP